MSKILTVHGLLGAGKDTSISFIKAHMFLYKQYKNDLQIQSTYIEDMIREAILEKDNHNWLCSELNIVIERFAKPLKTFICGLLGCTEEELNSQEFKSKQLNPEVFYSEKLGKVLTVRDLHTDVSDSLKETINLEIFATSCFERCKKHFSNGAEMVIINDLRYEDLELPLCNLNKSYLVKVTRVAAYDSNEKKSHSSEQGIPSDKFDTIIRNDSTYADLFKNILNMLVDAGIVTYSYKSYIEERLNQ